MGGLANGGLELQLHKHHMPTPRHLLRYHAQTSPLRTCSLKHACHSCWSRSSSSPKAVRRLTVSSINLLNGSAFPDFFLSPAPSPPHAIAISHFRPHVNATYLHLPMTSAARERTLPRRRQCASGNEETQTMGSGGAHFPEHPSSVQWWGQVDSTRAQRRRGRVSFPLHLNLFWRRQVRHFGGSHDEHSAVKGGAQGVGKPLLPPIEAL